MLLIDDPEDPRLDPVRDLKRRATGAPAATGLVIEGAIAVERALAAGTFLEQIFATPSVAARLEPLAGGVPVTPVSSAALSGALGFHFHRGCVAHGPRPPAHFGLDALHLSRVAGARTPALVAERVTDPRNLGALARSARAFRCPLMICDTHGADPWSRQAIRASMGHVFTLPALPLDNPLTAARSLRESLGAELIAATVDAGATDVRALPPTDAPRVLVVGNEGEGLSRAALGMCDHAVTVRIDPGADSLNVATAAAMLLWALSPA